MTPEQEIWAVALWVEKHHGAGGTRYIAEQIGRLALEGDERGATKWRKVAARYANWCSRCRRRTTHERPSNERLAEEDQWLTPKGEKSTDAPGPAAGRAQPRKALP